MKGILKFIKKNAVGVLGRSLGLGAVVGGGSMATDVIDPSLPVIDDPLMAAILGLIVAIMKVIQEYKKSTAVTKVGSVILLALLLPMASHAQAVTVIDSVGYAVVIVVQDDPTDIIEITSSGYITAKQAAWRTIWQQGVPPKHWVRLFGRPFVKRTSTWYRPSSIERRQTSPGPIFQTRPGAWPSSR